MGRLKRAKELFLEHLSFGSPRAIVVNLSGILVYLAAVPTSWVESGRSYCVFKNVIFPAVFAGHCPTPGCSCPACGLTRGMSNLLHGNLSAALQFNILTPAVLVTMLALIAINAFRVLKRKAASPG